MDTKATGSQGLPFLFLFLFSSKALICFVELTVRVMPFTDWLRPDSVCSTGKPLARAE